MPRRYDPWLTRTLVLLNVAAFAVQMTRGEAVNDFLHRWGLVPLEYWALWRGEPGAELSVLVTLLTSGFLHAGWLHLLVNMVYLLVFGSAVESFLGSRRFLGIYGAGLLAGAAAHVVMQADEWQPAVGASGAIAAVIASHLVLFPSATLGSLAPVLFFRPAASLPALALLVLWLLVQLIGGVASLGATVDVAWWSHVGGFVAGLALAPVLRPRRRHRW